LNLNGCLVVFDFVGSFEENDPTFYLDVGADLKSAPTGGQNKWKIGKTQRISLTGVH
jgi:hypothetical protein